MGIASTIKDSVEKACSSLGLEGEFSVEWPAREEMGDYSTNASLVLSRKAGVPPRELAEKIASKISIPGMEIEVAGPGFINFRASDSLLLSETEKAGMPGYGRSGIFKGMKVMVEFTDPNPFKEFHIGHLYSNSVGESISRILEFCGAEVRRADYFGDVGMHVAKAVWGMLRMMEEQGTAMDEIAKKPLDDRIKFMGRAYALGASAFKEDEKAAEEIRALNAMIYVISQDFFREKYGKEPNVDYTRHLMKSRFDVETVRKVYLSGRSWSLEKFKQIFRRLGTEFDFYYPESIAAEIGYSLVMEGLEKGIFDVSEGAVVFKGEKYGLHTRVFINSMGLPTYEAKEIGLAPMKHEDFPYDLSIIITGNEVDEYFRVLLKVLSILRPDLGRKTIHISHGMVRLPEGKMSSRTGNVIPGEWLVDEAKRMILEEMKERGGADEEVAEILAVASVKTSLLKYSVGSDIIFDFSSSVSIDGDSGPYLEYTHARARSILRKSDGIRVEDGEISDEERHVMRWIMKFPETVEKAGASKSPNTISSYLFELAKRFNSFYSAKKVVEGDAAVRHRLLITKAVAEILKTGMHLLGFRAVDRM